MKLSRLWRKLSAQRTRGYLYRVFTAAGVVAVGYGVISSSELALWAGLVATVFALPAANTPTDYQGRHERQ